MLTMWTDALFLLLDRAQSLFLVSGWLGCLQQTQQLGSVSWQF